MRSERAAGGLDWMLPYPALAGVVFGVNLLPPFGVPTWSLLVFFGLQSHIPAVPLVVIGALAAASGRLVLAFASRRLRDHRPAKRLESLAAARDALAEGRKRAVAGLGLFALSPLPSAQLFIAAGLVALPIVPLTAAFFAGRLVSYSIYVTAASAVKHSLGSTITTAFTSPLGDRTADRDARRPRRADANRLGETPVSPTSSFSVRPERRHTGWGHATSSNVALLEATHQASDHLRQAPRASEPMNENKKPILLCFDGSSDAENAIRSAGDLLGPRPAVVITVSEPLRLWEPSDPATVLDAPIGKLLAKALQLEEIIDEVAQEQANRGVELARAAGFDAQGRVARGKPWRAICEVANEIDAEAIVLGARGLSRVESALLGSVSATVSGHAGRPVLIIHHGRPSPRTPSQNSER